MQNNQTKKLPGMAAVMLMLLIPVSSSAQKFNRAEVTKVRNDVKLLTGTKQSRPASEGSVVSGETAVRTGLKSRAQMDFPDESIVRLGSNSVFSFKEGKRNVDLDKGTILMQVPKNLGKTRIRTSSISAAITGTTVMIEYIPPVKDSAGRVIRPGTFKAIVIEGTLELELNDAPGQVLTLNAGEMVAFPTNIRVFPKKFIIDLERLVKTSILVEGDMGPLPHKPIINREVESQKKKKKDGRLVEAGAIRDPDKMTPLPDKDINNSRRLTPIRPVRLPDRPERPERPDR